MAVTPGWLFLLCCFLAFAFTGFVTGMICLWLESVPKLSGLHRIALFCLGMLGLPLLAYLLQLLYLNALGPVRAATEVRTAVYFYLCMSAVLGLTLARWFVASLDQILPLVFSFWCWVERHLP